MSTARIGAAEDYVNPSALKSLQLERLQKIVKHTYDNVEVFRSRMQEKGLTPDCVKSLEDIAKLPFTNKTDLRDYYPFGLFATPMSEVVRLHASSGTTGKPIVVGYTKNDIELWADVMKRAFQSCGLNKNDVIQVSYGYGLFTGGLGAHYGTEALGATVVPTSGGNTQRQLMVMQDFGVTAICCTPSYFNFLAEKAAEGNINMRELPLKVGIFGAEPWTDAMRKQMQTNTGIEPYDIYGLSEIIGPGVAIECSEHNGLHIFEDHFYPEIVDPDTGEVLPDGAFGELVITTLTKEAFPMLRYRTKDICMLKREKCSCGRTHVKMCKPMGRSDDMLIIRGVNVFPSQIETVLLNHGYPANYQIIVDRVNHSDTLEVRVEMTSEMFTDNLGEVSRRQKELVNGLRSMLGLAAKVTLVAPKSIVRSEGKAVRIIDKRKI